MKALTSHIKIGQWNFNAIVKVEINSSIETLTDTCTLTIPRKFSWQGNEIAIGENPIIARGDKVIVKLGYDGTLQHAFTGFVKEIKAGVPVTITCDDYMYLLKKGKISKSYTSVTLQQLFEDIIPSDISYKVPDINLGSFRINNASIAKILEYLKNTYGIYSYFRNIKIGTDVKPILYSGLAYWYTDNRTTHKFRFEHNILDNHNLEYKKAEDIKLKVKAISIKRDNSKIEEELGDDDGELRTMHFYNLNKNDLRIFAENELHKFKYTGYRGALTTFGEPAVEKGDIASITGNKYHPDGKYFIKTVAKHFGTDGYKQELTMDYKL